MTQGEALQILKTGANVFLTGSPGAGKTHTVNAYVTWLREHGIEPSITASTGIAATHIHGLTIHSWSGIGISDRLTPELLDRIQSKEHTVKRIQKARVLIIDEISMLSGDVLSMVDRVCREVRGSELAFGGLQVVLVGDFFQLPPIGRRGASISFAFESDAWRALNPLVCYLLEQHRQEDDTFLDVLTAIREGTWDHTHVSEITARETEGSDLEDEVPRLYTHNEDVDRINEEQLQKLKGASKVYEMESSGAPTLIESLKRGCLSPERLMLRPGALVMCTKNNQAAGYANGTLGKVEGFEHATGNPIIETADGRSLTIAPADWAVEEDGKVRAKVTQVPLRLAWAITVHKSQGMSMDQAAMDLSRVFEHGQGYVALSRVRSLSGLHLLGWSEHAFSVHPDVGRMDKSFRELSEAARGAFTILEDNGEREAMERNFIQAAGGSVEPIGAPKKKISTQEETLELVRAGHNIPEIAKLRVLTVGTICDHVEKLKAEGTLSRGDIAALIPERLKKHEDIVHETFSKVGAEKLAPAHAGLKKKYSYDDLRILRLTYA
ncbi:MAG TPA: AAA family ATPase [Candidatus Paceibacterota bacterium]|nr:AAA family ATPase [Candidatus Paceibacterota bacterium]